MAASCSMTGQGPMRAGRQMQSVGEAQCEEHARNGTMLDEVVVQTDLARYWNDTMW